MILKTLGKVACVTLCFALVIVPFTISASAQSGTSIPPNDFITEGLNYEISFEMLEEDGYPWVESYQEIGGFGLSRLALDYIYQSNLYGQIVPDTPLWLSSNFVDVTPFDTPEYMVYVDQSFNYNSNGFYFLADNFSVEYILPDDEIGNQYYFDTARFTLTTDYFILNNNNARFGISSFNFDDFDVVSINITRINTATGEVTVLERERTTSDIPSTTNVLDISGLFEEIGYQQGDLYRVSFSLLTTELGTVYPVDLGFCYQVASRNDFLSLSSSISPADNPLLSYPVDYSDFNLLEWLGNAIDGFLTTTIFSIGEVNVTLGTIVSIPITLMILIVFLKKFAGG